MLKKIITLSIVTVILLIGVENVIAQEGTDVPEQKSRRRQGQEGRPRQRGRAQQFSGQQEKDSESQAKRTEIDKKIEAMRKNRQQALAQKGTPRGRVGRRQQQTRPGRNQPMQQMFGGRGPGFQGRGMGGWNRGYQCGGLCPCCQRGMCPWYEGFSGRGMGGRGRGFRGRGMMGRGGQGFQGRGMGAWSPGFQGRGMGRWGQGFRGRGMGRPGPDMPSPQGPPMQGRCMMDRRGPGFRGRGMGWGFPGPRGPEPEPENN